MSTDTDCTLCVGSWVSPVRDTILAKSGKHTLSKEGGPYIVRDITGDESVALTSMVDLPLPGLYNPEDLEEINMVN